MRDVIVGTNDRGRINLLRVGAERNTLYLASKEPDGTIILTPVDQGGEVPCDQSLG